MSKSKQLSNDEIIAFIEKPKSMRYIRKMVKPTFEKAQSKFGEAIVEIVEREHWGPNFDAYYDIWVRRRRPEVKEFISHSLHQLQDDKYIFVLAQVKETADYSDHPQISTRSNSASKNGKLAKMH
jgi:hypothetical protein